MSIFVLVAYSALLLFVFFIGYEIGYEMGYIKGIEDARQIYRETHNFKTEYRVVKKGG